MRLIVYFFIAGAIVSCATYQGKVRESRNLIRDGHHQQALEKLKILAEKPSDDQLVYLLDYATALQIAGQFEESNKFFLIADKIADRKDYHSVSNITLATLGSEEMIQYKGESYEKLFINLYLSLNFLMLNKHESALVEVRRVHEKIKKFKSDNRKDYEQNPFAHYLAAIIWESDKKFDDAYIDYESAYKLSSNSHFFAEDLIRSARLARREEAYSKWKKTFPVVKEDKNWYNKKYSELIVVYQQGWGPEKQFSPGDYRFPVLYPRHSQTTGAVVQVSNQGEYPTQVVYDLESVAIRTLHDDYAAMAARKLGAIVAKEVAADQIRQKNEALGDLAWIIMRVSDRADLRQWSTLPKTIQVARVWLPVGKHKVIIQGKGFDGSLSGEFSDMGDIDIRPGVKSIIYWRSVR